MARKNMVHLIAPSFFGNIELGSVPAEEDEKLIGRVVEATLYDITGDFSHMYMKMYFQVNEVDGKTAKTLFKGHEYSRDFLRSLVRRRTTKVDGLFNLNHQRRLQTKNRRFSPHTVTHQNITGENHPPHHGPNRQRKSRSTNH